MSFRIQCKYTNPTPDCRCNLYNWSSMLELSVTMLSHRICILLFIQILNTESKLEQYKNAKLFCDNLPNCKLSKYIKNQVHRHSVFEVNISHCKSIMTKMGEIADGISRKLDKLINYLPYKYKDIIRKKIGKGTWEYLDSEIGSIVIFTPNKLPLYCK